MRPRHRQIAGGDQLAPRRRRHALDGRDDRLGQGGDLLHEGGAAAHGLLEEGAALVGRGAGFGDLAQVMARAEGRAFA